MRNILAALLVLGSSVSMAQQAPLGMPGIETSPSNASSPPTVGAARPADSFVGDEVSKERVKPARCSVAARETDGTTTCIGIPAVSQERRRR
jgi:hypothetical protein